MYIYIYVYTCKYINTYTLHMSYYVILYYILCTEYLPSIQFWQSKNKTDNFPRSPFGYLSFTMMYP